MILKIIPRYLTAHSKCSLKRLFTVLNGLEINLASYLLRHLKMLLSSLMKETSLSLLLKKIPNL